MDGRMDGGTGGWIDKWVVSKCGLEGATAQLGRPAMPRLLLAKPGESCSSLGN